MIKETRLRFKPVAVLWAFPKTVGVIKAWISTRIGRVPSRDTTTADPVASLSRSSKKISEGFATSVKPRVFISKIPNSLVDPNRFLTDRKIR